MKRPQNSVQHWRSKGAMLRFVKTFGAAFFVAAGASSMAIGCAIFSDRNINDAEAQAYEVAFHRMVQGHVYEMGCDALLPLAQEVLWDADFQQVEYQGNNDGLQTEWVDRDEMLRARYEVHPHRVDDNRCAVQFLYREEAGAAESEQRAVGREIELLEHVDPEEAKRIRTEARREARRVTSEQR